jgi:hypothetical protein
VSTQTFCPLWSPARSPGPSFFLSCSVRILLRFTFRLPANGEAVRGRVLGFWRDGELGRFVVCVSAREFGFGRRLRRGCVSSDLFHYTSVFL